MGAAASRAALAAAVVLLAATACGGGGHGSGATGGATGGGRAGGSGGKATAASVPGGKAVPLTLTQQQLEGAVLTSKDAPHWTTYALGDGADHRPTAEGGGDAAKMSDPECAPLYSMTTQMAGRQRSHGAVVRSVDVPDGSDLRLGLRAYSAADAAQLMTDLRTALQSCPSSFAVPQRDETYGHTARLADPALGDEALAYRIVESLAGDDPDITTPGHGLFQVVVVRCGATIAAFVEMSLDKDGWQDVPTAFVDAQVAKLGKVPVLH